jgi:hypothetical protein
MFFLEFFFFFSDAKFKPAATHALTQPRTSAEGARFDTRTRTTKGVGGRSSLGPADAVGTVRLMPSLPDDVPSPSQAS